MGYEQSINSFFAEDDPYMAVYQQAAKTFGDDNFIFLVYDDPALLTPQGLERVSELAAAVAPERIAAVQRVESLDAMPLLWSIDDALLALDRLPGMARNLALNAAKRAVKNVDLKTNAMTVAGAVRAAAADPAALAKLKDRLTRHPLFLGTVIDATGTTTAVVARLKKTHQHNVIETVAEMRRIADEFAARHQLGRPAVVGPPVLLSDGFAAIEVDGRRLAVVGMILIGVVTLSAVQSLWWAIVPMLAGWVVWLATEAILTTFNIKLSLSGGPLVAQIIVLTMPAASHLAIHFRDERRRAGRPAPGRPLDPGRGRRADRLDGDHRRDRLWGTRHQRRGADSTIWRDPGHLHVRRGDPGHADLADRHAPAVSPGSPRPARLALARGRVDEPADSSGLPSSRRDRPDRLRHRLAPGRRYVPSQL